MKLGNTSQSSVPVPNFFLNKNINQMETFQVSKGKRYFREKDLFQSTKELNFSNSTRNMNKKHENFNRTKYIPDITTLNTFLNRSNNSLKDKKKHNESFKEKDYNKDNYIQTENEKENTHSGRLGTDNIKKDSFQNFRNYMEKTNVSNYTNKDLREQIKTNINVLIDKITNTNNYDLDKWMHVDTRTNFIDTNTDSDLNNFSKSNKIFDTIYNGNFPSVNGKNFVNNFKKF